MTLLAAYTLIALAAAAGLYIAHLERGIDRAEANLRDQYAAPLATVTWIGDER